MMDSSTVSSNTCVITLVKNNSLSPVKFGSCSGVFINHKLDIVLTHGSLLAELNSKDYEQLRRDLTANKLTNLLPNHSTEVMFDARRWQVQNSSNLNQHYDLSSDSCQNTATETEMYPIFPATIELIFKCESFHRTSEQFLAKSQGWFFPPRKHFLLPYFILIKLRNFNGLLPTKSLLLKSSVECNSGDIVEVFGTPYGDLCAKVFLNSVSRGVISNYFGSNKVQILTDARCIPGTEGGLVCTFDNNNMKRAIGMVVSPFCWKNQSWIGLTLVCSLEEILNSMALASVALEAGEIPKELWKPFSASPLNTNSSSSSVVSNHPKSSPYNFTLSEKIKQGMCRVIGQKGNGTGILISHDTILTCSHVVCGDFEVSVKLHKDKHWHRATRVYSTPLNESFDVAVLKLNNCCSPPTKLVPFPEITAAVEGMPVYAVGYALFTTLSDPQLTVTSGVVASIVQHKQADILIQTTCAVYPGSSGGAVLSESGNIVGMACSNVKMLTNQAHVSLLIPMTTLKLIIEPYLQNGDIKCLKQLWLQSDKQRQIWRLQSTVDHNRNPHSKL